MLKVVGGGATFLTHPVYIHLLQTFCSVCQLELWKMVDKGHSYRSNKMQCTIITESAQPLGQIRAYHTAAQNKTRAVRKMQVET